MNAWNNTRNRVYVRVYHRVLERVESRVFDRDVYSRTSDIIYYRVRIGIHNRVSWPVRDRALEEINW
jgi:hypothetical protein